MNCNPATFRRDGLTSAYSSRERKAKSKQQLRRPRTVAAGEHERKVDRAGAVKSTWLQRAKVYEESFVAMKNKNAVKKQNSRSHMPQAYDIEEHLDCGHGVVVIGKNGFVTNDQYYVKCMKRSKPVPSTGSDVDSSFLSSEDESSVDTINGKVPLCWKQQLQDKDVVRICEATTSIPSVTITKSKNQHDQEIPEGKGTVKLREETKKKVDHQPFIYIMMSWGKTSIMEWKDCLPLHLHHKSNDTMKAGVDDMKAYLPSLDVLLDHIKEHDHTVEWRHIHSTLCIWLSCSHINKDNTYEVYLTDSAPVCTRAFSGVKARPVYDNIYIICFDLVKSLPWVTSLSEIQGKHFNITISRFNQLLRTEMKLLCEDIQLGTAFEDNWCHPRNFPNDASHINCIEDLDEDKTDLLAISDLLPDLLKFSPNSSLDTSQEHSQPTGAMESGTPSTDQSGKSDNARSVLITQKSLLWKQGCATSAGHTGGNALLHDKGHLLNTELALSRTIRNYNHKRHHLPVKSQNGKGLANTLVHHNKARPHHWQDSKTTRRPKSNVVHKKSSMSRKTPKVRPFSAAQVTNTNTAKDLELLTKSICRHLSIQDDLK